MYQTVCKVLMILCVLVSWSGAKEIDDSAPCDISIQDSNNLTLNCSRRNIDIIPEWPKQLNDFEKDGHVLITFFNNSITNVSLLASLPGNRIAISFKSNEIIEIEDDAFRNLDRLVYLDLSNNYISDLFELLQKNNEGFGEGIVLKLDRKQRRCVD